MTTREFQRQVKGICNRFPELAEDINGLAQEAYAMIGSGNSPSLEFVETLNAIDRLTGEANEND